MSRYDDIINMPHHQSTKHAHMSIHDRAAQFAPFAALKGYEEAVVETARYTNQRKILDDNEIERLDAILQYLSEICASHPIVRVTHFVDDLYKSGGEYVDYVGSLKSVDSVYKTLLFDDEKQISIEDIINIEIC